MPAWGMLSLPSSFWGFPQAPGFPASPTGAESTNNFVIFLTRIESFNLHQIADIPFIITCTPRQVAADIVRPLQVTLLSASPGHSLELWSTSLPASAHLKLNAGLRTHHFTRQNDDDRKASGLQIPVCSWGYRWCIRGAFNGERTRRSWLTTEQILIM